MEVYVRLRPQIIQNLTQIDDVLDYLQSDGHITTRNYETIKSQNTESNSIRKMLEILQKRNCLPETFIKILSETGNESLKKQFQEYFTKMGREVDQEKPKPQARDKRKIFILEGMDTDEKLRECFSRSNPNWEVSFIFGSITKLKEEIASLPENKFSYFDIIVVCDEDYKYITNKSLKTILPRIEKELLPKFPPSISTFLIIVDVNDDNGYVFHSDTKPVSFGDAQIRKPVFRILKTKFLHGFIETFFRHEEMFNIFIAKKFDLENNFMKNNPSEGKTDKRKIFIVEGMEQNEKLHEHFSRDIPDWDVSFIFSHESLMEQIASIPLNEFSFFDIIVVCDEDSNEITNESLRTMLSKYPTSIITFLITVNEMDDNKTESQPEINNDTEGVIALLKREFFPEFWDSFIKSKEMFNVFIRKADTRKHLRIQVHGREKLL
ncbi:uncharacterized protein LOC118768009 isoform X1 [Octopus sinensis]|uniref:Uncharacterized protein LOC118768009 isoform X1 n=1 Tax=Octopus sinensis TaxID=2607531 RepID=A0A7E6FPV2_9MOLL|nr:uncharacterized protein LOC118768009 isoform X1 [Octopus sinensis]